MHSKAIVYTLETSDILFRDFRDMLRYVHSTLLFLLSTFPKMNFCIHKYRFQEKQMKVPCYVYRNVAVS